MSKSEKSAGDSFGRWYERNAGDYNEKRRERYRNDPNYREKVKSSANAARKRERTPPPPDTHPYDFTTTASKLGVSVYSLRDWRRREYFPEPLKVGLKLYFTGDQLALLRKLKKFLEKGGGRRIDELEDVKNMILLNWGE